MTFPPMSNVPPIFATIIMIMTIMIMIMTKIMIAMIVCLRSHLFSHLKPGYSGTNVPGEYTTIIALNDYTKILTKADTETFFQIPNFPKPKPTLFSETNFF